MERMPIIYLNRHETHRVFNGHCWIYRSEVDRTEGHPEDGDFVVVRDFRNKFCGIGYYNAQSQIVVRIITRREEEINPEFWISRLQQAISYRNRVLPGKECRRLVFSEADQLPGLIVDQYGRHLVLQTTTLGMDFMKLAWVDWLKNELSPQSIIERNDLSVRKLEGLKEEKGVLFGEADPQVQARVGDVTFEFNLLDPHKTGFYLDQQLNYQTLAEYTKGKRVLDAFCHLAGFGIHAALNQATEVVAIDSSPESISGAEKTAQAAGVSDRMKFRCENAFDFLKQAERSGEKFDMIILDPPSFTRTRAAVGDALRGYKEIHIRALRMLHPGGVLATFCCSHHVSSALFLDTILEASVDVRQVLRQEMVLGASPDHPVVPSIPETSYLKGYIFSFLG